MQYIGRAIGVFFKKADMLLLLLCTVTTIFGIVVISSATQVEGSARYVGIQAVALVLGCPLLFGSAFVLCSMAVIMISTALMLVMGGGSA